MLRYLTAGESHGDSLVAILEGMVAGVRVERDKIDSELKNRRSHLGRSNRMQIEDENFEILSGLRNELTTGAPIAVRIKNKDKKELEDYSPRPGHADLAGCLKYGFQNIHLIAERASARETSLRVAIGVIAKNFLSNFKIEFVSHTVKIGNLENKNRYSFEYIKKKRFLSPIFCVERQSELMMIEKIKEAEAKGDTIGGETEVIVRGLPVGLGSHVHYDRRLEYRLGGALLSIPGVKGLMFGHPEELGSINNDSIIVKMGKIIRGSNQAGGLEGGISNGQEIIIRLMIKPPPSLRQKIESVDLRINEPHPAPILRGDTCVVPAAGIVAENILALELASFFLEKFGGDSLEEVKRNWSAYLKKIYKKVKIL
ncbi:MAG: chorismate synthase [Candidatus Saccharicenans sp.]|uniref:chorismate synthase n=1 Tax=Candidatus Saccharicenans sp. TaxID=2819258 RepID=UPI00404AA49D